MNVNVGISGIGSSARLRALVLVREAISKREQQREGVRGTAELADRVRLATDTSSERG
jgi:hypothetical protein